MKTCYQCKKEKPFTDYFKNKGKKNGISSECKKCSVVLRIAYKKKYLDRFRRHCMNHEMKKNYGVSRKEYETLVEKQSGRCAICGQYETAKNARRLSIDHDHRTLKIRGLLCKSCNGGIGFMKENIQILKNAIEYLVRNGVL